MARFVRRVLADTEDVWERVFQAAGKRYEKPKLVLFTRAIRRPHAASASRRWGRSIARSTRRSTSISTSTEELKQRFHAPGDFAQAYVIAHEVGHHVQTLLGVADKVQGLKQQAMQRGDEREVNELQVRMELQADCLAGVWANLNDQMKQRLEPGDIESGLNAAAADRRRHAAEAHRRAGWCRSPSRTAPRSSACAGSSKRLRERPDAGLRHLRPGEL